MESMQSGRNRHNTRRRHSTRLDGIQRSRKPAHPPEPTSLRRFNTVCQSERHATPPGVQLVDGAPMMPVLTASSAAPSAVTRPPRSRRVPGVLNDRLCRLLLLLLAILLSGCPSSRRFARSSSPAAPSAAQTAIDSPPPAAAQEATPNAATASPPVATTALPRAAEDKPRRIIPDWLRLNKAEEPVPLPTTAPVEANTAATSVAGPVEEFQ